MTDLELTPTARAHRDAMLPGLLGAVRQRRRWRTVRRVVAAALVVGLVGTLPFVDWRGPASDGGGGRAIAANGDGEAGAFVIERVATSVGDWSTVGNVPGAVERYAVGSVRRAEWFVDDRGLNDLLQGADRRFGVVRVPGRVIVNAAAVDPWPAGEE